MNHCPRLIISFSLALLIVSCGKRAAIEIPYDRTNPIIYDNDSAEDVYTDELIMALHTAHRIDLRGVITTEGGWRDPWDTSDLIARHEISARRELVAKAQRSGMSGGPAPVAGPIEPIARPPSGRISDTVPQGTAAAKLIVAEAHRATVKKPLAIIAGGPVSSVADAFLLDYTIADKVIVAWNGDWNVSAEPYRLAAESLVCNFTCAFDGKVVKNTSAYVNAGGFQRFAPTELQRFMTKKEQPHANLPGKRVFDAPPVIPLIDSGYLRKEA